MATYSSCRLDSPWNNEVVGRAVRPQPAIFLYQHTVTTCQRYGGSWPRRHGMAWQQETIKMKITCKAAIQTYRLLSLAKPVNGWTVVMEVINAQPDISLCNKAS